MSDALDRDCLRYLEHWEPVLAGPARRALARLGPAPTDLLDLGAGTGSLTLAALARWPSTRVRALDASAAMLAVARSRVPDHDRERVSWTVADAADIPLDEASTDAVVCAFALQLVADRPAVLEEVRRVLRPGGAFAFVTWLADDLLLPADAAYHDVLGDLADDDEAGGFRSPRSGDYLSLAEARGELHDAGFEAVRVESDELRYTWTAESYLAFKTDYDDHERIGSLEPAERERLQAALLQRLATLPATDFEVSGPLVTGVARRPC
ncbi:MAG: methyltransferase domain-containing protein [Candidatus Limnocylindrales bacterium]